MYCCRETMKMGVPPGNRPAASRDWFRGVPERYVAGADTRGRQEGRPYPWSQQVIHEISGLKSGGFLYDQRWATRGKNSLNSGTFMPRFVLPRLIFFHHLFCLVVLQIQF
jgi:hypothetical protein